jgi:hypothetical protein
MNQISNTLLLQTFETDCDEKIKPYLDLGWIVSGTMRKPNELRPEKGDFIFVQLNWPDYLGGPVHPQ